MAAERFCSAANKAMRYKRTRKFYAAAAVILALSMLASGCSKEDSGSGEATETVSINVIGGDNADSGNEDSAGTSESKIETEVVTDENGETLTGVNGDVMTRPVATDIDPAKTLSEEDIMNAMTATTPPPQININKYTGKRYGYDTLTSKEKELYDAILSGIENLRYKICSEDAYTLEEWAKIYGLVYNQEPQLFYMDSKMKVGKLFYITKDQDAINQMQKAIDATTDKLVKEANGKSTTFEKLKVFHDYLVLNSTFELNDSDVDYNATIYNALGSSSAQGNIQCAGYAKTMQYLCDRAGITCMVITGETTEGRSHAWNVVDVDGEWYNLDTTWDDPVLETPNYKNLGYKYFLVPDSWIHNISHMHVNQKKLTSGKYITYFTPPSCTATAKNYFKQNGLVYNDVDSADKAIRAEIKKAAEDGSRVAHIMVGSKDVYRSIFDARTEYSNYAKGLSGVRGLSNNSSEEMLLIEFDVLYS